MDSPGEHRGARGWTEKWPLVFGRVLVPEKRGQKEATLPEAPSDPRSLLLPD